MEPVLPRHIAVIMDGNGRWARLRGKPRVFGHRQGTETARKVVRFCSDAGVGNLTLYTFSSENWKRPKREVDFLMNLVGEMVDREVPEMMERNVRMTVLGQPELLPARGRAKLREAEEKTAGNTGMRLCLAISYGGRQEIVAAAAKRAARAAAGEIRPEEVDEAAFAGSLFVPDLPDVDLMIRTGGEFRVSNFLPWQSVYAELFFSQKLWPDFGDDDMRAALEFYASRDRRFGGVNEEGAEEAE